MTEDIPRLSTAEAIRVERTIRLKLMVDPLLFAKPLRYSLKSVRSLRVGDWRVLFVVAGVVVRILAIKHRSAVYKRSIEKRF